MNYRKICLYILLAVSTIVLTFYISSPSNKHDPVLTGTDGLLPLRSAGPASGTPLSVLFIGNSYTYVNDLPGLILKIADSNPDNHVRLQIESVAIGGAHLEDHWKQGPARQALLSRHWDYVVLQEQSLWAEREDWAAFTYYGARHWLPDLKRSASHILIYETWARKEGDDWYRDPAYPKPVNAAAMQKQIDRHTAILARQLGAGIVPVGPFWQAAQRRIPGIDLYAADDSHPSMTGTFLAGLVFYRALTGQSPAHTTLRPADVPASTVKNLIALASE